MARYTVDTLRIIEEEPERLTEVEGLGPKRTERIMRAWAEQKAIKEVMAFLQGVGVSTSLAVRIYKIYQDGAIAVVQHEPYRPAAGVWGTGFKTADKVAQAQGIPHDSPERIKAGLQYTLSVASQEGHCFLPEADLVAQAAKILGLGGRASGAACGGPGAGGRDRARAPAQHWGRCAGGGGCR